MSRELQRGTLVALGFFLRPGSCASAISHGAAVVSALVEPVGMIACDYRWGVVSHFCKMKSTFTKQIILFTKNLCCYENYP